MGTKPTSIDDYLSALPEDQRAALQSLRDTIRRLAPDAVECISYGLPAFRLGRKAIAGFGAGAHHCAYYPMSGATTAALQDELAGYATSKAAIRFQPHNPLPTALVSKLIEARIREDA